MAVPKKFRFGGGPPPPSPRGGPHDPRPNRQRQRGQEERTILEEWEEIENTTEEEGENK